MQLTKTMQLLASRIKANRSVSPSFMGSLYVAAKRLSIMVEKLEVKELQHRLRINQLEEHVAYLEERLLQELTINQSHLPEAMNIINGICHTSDRQSDYKRLSPPGEDNRD